MTITVVNERCVGENSGRRPTRSPEAQPRPNSAPTPKEGPTLRTVTPTPKELGWLRKTPFPTESPHEGAVQAPHRRHGGRSGLRPHPEARFAHRPGPDPAGHPRAGGRVPLAKEQGPASRTTAEGNSRGLSYSGWRPSKRGESPPEGAASRERRPRSSTSGPTPNQQAEGAPSTTRSGCYRTDYRQLPGLGGSKCYRSLRTTASLTPRHSS